MVTPELHPYLFEKSYRNGYPNFPCAHPDLSTVTVCPQITDALSTVTSFLTSKYFRIGAYKSLSAHIHPCDFATHVIDHVWAVEGFGGIVYYYRQAAAKEQSLIMSKNKWVPANRNQ